MWKMLGKSLRSVGNFLHRLLEAFFDVVEEAVEHMFSRD